MPPTRRPCEVALETYFAQYGGTATRTSERAATTETELSRDAGFLACRLVGELRTSAPTGELAVDATPDCTV